MYQYGFFDPQRAQEALTCLEGMEFEGIDQMKEKIQQGQTLLNICRQLSQENAMLKQAIGASMGIPPQGGGAPAPQQGGGGSAPPPGSVGPAQGLAAVPDEVMQSRQPQTGYMQKILARSQPNMNMPSASAQPAPAGS